MNSLLFYKIFISVLIASCVFMIIKVTNEYKQDIRIITAIRDYLIDKQEEISTGDLSKDFMYIESMYDSVSYYKPKLYRLIDWGYTNIVPPDVLEKIKPYIKG